MNNKRGCPTCNGVDPKSCLRCKGKTRMSDWEGAAMNTPTPRTDAIFPLVCGSPVVVPETISELREKFAELERDLAAAQEALRKQGQSALMGMDAAKAIASHNLESAKALNAQSNPAALDEARALNERLTSELEAAAQEARQRAEADAERYRLKLHEIREVWAGSECGEPVYAQEAYAIRLCKQMYQIACDALSGKAPVAPDEVNRLSVRCESQRLKIDAQDARIKRLEEALRGLSSEAEELDYKFLSANDVKVERAIISAKEWQSVIAALRRARAALEDK